MDIVVAGMRTTGQLHIGHLAGALENFRRLQDSYQSYFFLADLHVLTTHYENTEDIAANRVEVMLDWLSVGLDPQKAVLFIQSRVPEHTYLHLLLSMIVPIPWVERNTTVKDMIRDLELKETASYGLLGYPILQTADIILYKAKYVPVGKDQLPHLEIAREVVRRFNFLYGELFVEPQALLTEFPNVPGVDGKKMSKSLNNDIKIASSEEDTTRKVMSAITDPQKLRKGDKGRPDICTIFTYHRIFNSEESGEIREGCQNGTLGCVECKKRFAEKLNTSLKPIRERRKQLQENSRKVIEVFEEGSRKAQTVARKTLDEALELMHIK